MTAPGRRCRHEMLFGQCSLCAHLPDDDLYEAAALGTTGRASARAAAVESDRPPLASRVVRS